MPGSPPSLTAALSDRYAIERELGEGGMATVYLAEDLKHHRKVALKVLKPELAAVVGAERFLGEIETTANLQHPHILPLFDSGEADGFLFYVMPYVEGETLRERLEREKQLPIDDAVRIGRQVAQALDHAHRRGVIHRDIKPGNILLQDGEPVVADFGIALAVGSAGGSRLTETGLSVGTPYYMSPEQATGDQSVGPASDVYSLACVTYELLTGDPPYQGSTAQAVLGKIIAGVPTPPRETRASIPVHVDAALRKALEKLPADRFATAAAFAEALGDPSFRHGVSEAAVQAGVARRWRGRALALGVVAVVALVGLVLALLPSDGAREPASSRQRVVLGSGINEMALLVAHYSALAPDGSGILYGDTTGLSGAIEYWWKPRDALDPVPVDGLAGAVAPAFSPDGEWIVYGSRGELRKRPLQGGSSVTLADSVDVSARAAIAWLADGTIVYESQGGNLGRLLRIPAEGRGEAELIAEAREFGNFIHASAFPDGAGVLFATCPVGSCQGTSELFAMDLETGRSAKLAEGALRGWLLPGDMVVYLGAEGTVLAGDFDRASMTMDAPVPVFEGVRTTRNMAEIQVGPDGTILYVRGGSLEEVEYEMVWADREGTVRPVDPTWRIRPGGNNRGWAISPDGSRVAIGIGTAGAEDIWIKPLPAGPPSRITFDPTQDVRPRWDPEGEWVTFVSERDGVAGIYRRRWDGTGPVESVVQSPRQLWEAAHAPDGSLIVRTGGTTGAAGGRDLLIMEAGDTALEDLVASNFDEKAATVSPDGRWLVYESDETGRNEIYARPFPNVGDGKWLVSDGGGVMPRWDRSGEEVFYVNGAGELVAARLRPDGGFPVQSRITLFSVVDAGLLFNPVEQYPLYDVDPGGDRFLMLRPLGGGGITGASELVLVRGALDEIRSALGR